MADQREKILINAAISCAMTHGSLSEAYVQSMEALRAYIQERDSTTLTNKLPQSGSSSTLDTKPNPDEDRIIQRLVFTTDLLDGVLLDIDKHTKEVTKTQLQENIVRRKVCWRLHKAAKMTTAVLSDEPYEVTYSGGEEDHNYAGTGDDSLSDNGDGGGGAEEEELGYFVEPKRRTEGQLSLSGFAAIRDFLANADYYNKYHLNLGDLAMNEGSSSTITNPSFCYEDCPLPGWRKELSIRLNGKNRGTTEVWYTPPDKSRRLKTKADLLSYLSQQNLTSYTAWAFDFGRVYCVCQTKEESECTYIECSFGKGGCGGWVHSECVGLGTIEEEEMEHMGSVICPLCTVYLKGSGELDKVCETINNRKDSDNVSEDGSANDDNDSTSKTSSRAPVRLLENLTVKARPSYTVVNSRDVEEMRNVPMDIKWGLANSITTKSGGSWSSNLESRNNPSSGTTSRAEQQLLLAMACLDKASTVSTRNKEESNTPSSMFVESAKNNNPDSRRSSSTEVGVSMFDQLLRAADNVSATVATINSSTSSSSSSSSGDDDNNNNSTTMNGLFTQRSGGIYGGYQDLDDSAANYRSIISHSNSSSSSSSDRTSTGGSLLAALLAGQLPASGNSDGGVTDSVNGLYNGFLANNSGLTNRGNVFYGNAFTVGADGGGIVDAGPVTGKGSKKPSSIIKHSLLQGLNFVSPTVLAKQNEALTLSLKQANCSSSSSSARTKKSKTTHLRYNDEGNDPEQKEGEGEDEEDEEEEEEEEEEEVDDSRYHYQGNAVRFYEQPPPPPGSSDGSSSSSHIIDTPGTYTTHAFVAAVAASDNNNNNNNNNNNDNNDSSSSSRSTTVATGSSMLEASGRVTVSGGWMKLGKPSARCETEHHSHSQKRGKTTLLQQQQQQSTKIPSLEERVLEMIPKIDPELTMAIRLKRKLVDCAVTAAAKSNSIALSYNISNSLAAQNSRNSSKVGSGSGDASTLLLLSPGSSSGSGGGGGGGTDSATVTAIAQRYRVPPVLCYLPCEDGGVRLACVVPGGPTKSFHTACSSGIMCAYCLELFLKPDGDRNNLRTSASTSSSSSSTTIFEERGVAAVSQQAASTPGERKRKRSSSTLSSSLPSTVILRDASNLFSFRLHDHCEFALKKELHMKLANFSDNNLLNVGVHVNSGSFLPIVPTSDAVDTGAATADAAAAAVDRAPVFHERVKIKRLYECSEIDDATCDLCGRAGGILVCFDINTACTGIAPPSGDEIGWLGHIPCLHYLATSQLLQPLVALHAHNVVPEEEEEEEEPRMETVVIVKDNKDNNDKEEPSGSCDGDEKYCHSKDEECGKKNVAVPADHVTAAAADTPPSTTVPPLPAALSDTALICDTSGVDISEAPSLENDCSKSVDYRETTTAAAETASTVTATATAASGTAAAAASTSTLLTPLLTASKNTNSAAIIISATNDSKYPFMPVSATAASVTTSLPYPPRSRFDRLLNQWRCSLCGLQEGITLRCAAAGCTIRAHPHCVTVIGGSWRLFDGCYDSSSSTTTTTTATATSKGQKKGKEKSNNSGVNYVTSDKSTRFAGTVCCLLCSVHSTERLYSK